MVRYGTTVILFLVVLFLSGCATKSATAKKTAYANQPAHTDTSRDVGADRMR